MVGGAGVGAGVQDGMGGVITMDRDLFRGVGVSGGHSAGVNMYFLFLARSRSCFVWRSRWL